MHSKGLCPNTSFSIPISVQSSFEAGCAGKDPRGRTRTRLPHLQLRPLSKSRSPVRCRGRWIPPSRYVSPPLTHQDFSAPAPGVLPGDEGERFILTVLQVTRLAGGQPRSLSSGDCRGVTLALLQVAAVLGQSQALVSVQPSDSKKPRSAFVMEVTVKVSVPSQKPAGLLLGHALNPHSH